MELSAKYAYMIWKKKSFSSAAKALFISQPALSATIAKLEKELGFKIFNRCGSPITLTLRGSIYMDYLEEIIERENTFEQRIRAVNNMSYGSLTVRGRMSSALKLLPTICGKFYHRYPNINVTIDINQSRENSQDKPMDLVFSFEPDPKGCDAIALLEERLIIALHKNHPCADKLSHLATPFEQISARNIDPHKEITDISIFRDVMFIKTGSTSDSDKRLSQMIPNHKVAPYVITTTPTFELRYELMLEGIGALLVSDLFVKDFVHNREDVLFFALRNPLSFRTLYIQPRNSDSENEIINKFIATAIECCQDIIQTENRTFC